MKVREAVKQLLDAPQDADLMICAHGFAGKENMAWIVTEFYVPNDEQVLIEGAGDPPKDDGGEGDSTQSGEAE